MGKIAKRIARDSLTNKRVRRVAASDESDARIEERFLETQSLHDEDEPQRTIRFGPALPIAKQQTEFNLELPEKVSSSEKRRRSMAMEANLNVELLETVVQIIDYTAIPELPPTIQQRPSFRRRPSIRKSTSRRLSKKEMAKLKEQEPEEEMHEVDLDQKEFVTTKSLEMEILQEWWDLKNIDSKERLKKTRATITIGKKLFKIRSDRVRTLSEEESAIIFYEESMNVHGVKSPMRSEFKEFVGVNAFQRILKYTKMLLHHGSTSSDTRFTCFEFSVMLLLHEFNLIQNGHLGHNFAKYGTGPTMLAHTFILFCIEMPFVLKIMTMASFSQTYVLHFFRSMPLLQGIGYVTLILYIIMQSEVALYFEGAFRVLLFLVTAIPDWKNCPLMVNEYKCIRFMNTSDHNCTKPYTPGASFYSTQYFMNNVIFSREDLDLPWYISHGPIVMWLLVLVIAINGISLIKKVTIRLQVWLCILPGAMAISVLVYRAYSVQQGDIKSYNTQMSWHLIFTPDFIIDAITVGTKIHHLPYLVWVCSMKPVNASIEFYTSLIIFISIIMTWGSASLYISCLDIINWTYNLEPTCIHILPRDHAFSLIPDMLLHLSFAKSWIVMWFISVLYFYAIYVVYAINVTVDTFIQCVPKLNKVSLVLTTFVWGCVCTLRYARMHPAMYEIVAFLHPEKFSIIGSILFGMLAFGLQFFYGQERFHDDFMFYNNRSPKKFWTVTWHIIVYLGTIGMICGMIIQCIHATRADDSSKAVEGLIELLISSLAFMIISSFFVRRSCYWMYVKRLKESFNPDVKWGSPDTKMVLLRKFYFSARDIRVRHTKLNCSHRCMLMAYEYKHTQYMQMMKLARIMGVHKRHQERVHGKPSIATGISSVEKVQ